MTEFKTETKDVSIKDIQNLIGLVKDGLNAPVTFNNEDHYQMALDRITALEQHLQSILMNLVNIAKDKEVRVMATNDGLLRAEDEIGSEG